jgi:hypothetical protein
MKRLSAFLFVIGLGLSFNAHAWFFFFLPTGAIADAITGAEGANCVSDSTKVGDLVSLNGVAMKVKSLSGTSMRCTDEKLPVRALLEVDNSPQVSAITAAKLELPDSWENKTLTPAMKAQAGVMLATNRAMNSSLGLFALPKEKVVIPDLNDWAKMMMDMQLTSLTEGKVSQITKLNINGAEVWQAEVTGILKVDMKNKHTYLKTIYAGDKEVVLLNLDTVSENYESQKAEFLKIANSVSGLVARPKALESTASESPKAKTTPAANMGDAKQKCIELGFKVGTESFGQCVLKLAK